MQDQGKRLLLIGVITIGVMMLWQGFFGEKPKKTDTASNANTPGALAGPAVAQSMVGEPLNPATPAVVAQRGPEQTIELAHPGFVATFTSHGGGIKSWRLTDARYQRDPRKGELLPQNGDAAALQVNFVNSTYVLPKNAEWVGKKISETSVAYELATPEVVVRKTFSLTPAQYLVELKVEVQAVAGEATQQIAVTSFAFQDPKEKGGGGQSVKARVWESVVWVGDEMKATPIKDVQNSARVARNITWTGFAHPYLLNLMTAKRATGEQLEKHTYPVGNDGLMRTDLWLPPAKVAVGTALVRDVAAYLGPNQFELLRASSDKTAYSTGFEKYVDLGWFGIIGRPLLWLLKKIQGVVGNWGIAIMLLTVIVKLLTLYWTTQSMRSMKRMGALAPKMKELQERYKDDRARLQQEQMALYKTHNINPLAGCMPMLLQMPIWIALYRMLSSAGELYLQPFGWISDLTNADPLYILPVVLTGTMFWQMRLTPQSGDSQQQKIMLWLMPLMFGGMSFMFPAGLTLYIFTNTLLSAAHSIYMNKYDHKTKAAVEAVEAAVVKPAVAASEAKPLKNGANSGTKTGAGTQPAAKSGKKKR